MFRVVCWTLLAIVTFNLHSIELSGPPVVTKSKEGIKIDFAVSASTDVEVAILNSKGEVVRHLAAGVLGGKNAPPAPLKPSLSQSVIWDGKDDFGNLAAGAPFQVRTRAGSKFTFGRFIGEDPYTFGNVDGLGTDADGNLYISGFSGTHNQGARTLRQYGSQGQYLREYLPFPSDLKAGAMKEVAHWSDEKQGWLPRNSSCLIPNYYTEGMSQIALVAVSPTEFIFANSDQVFKLNRDGSIAGTSFGTQQRTTPIFDAKNKEKDHYEHPWHYQTGLYCYSASPDGKYLYLTGPVPNENSRKKPDPRFPLGGIYRMQLDGKDEMKLFATIPAEYNGNWSKDGFKNYGTSSPIHFVGCDAKNNVYVPDRSMNRVVVFSEDGKQVGEFPCKNPHQIVVNPKTNEVYVLRMVCTAWNAHALAVEKFSPLGPNMKSLAVMDKFPNKVVPRMTVAAGKEHTLIWIAGVDQHTIALEDKGSALVPVETQFKQREDAQLDWNRLTVDYARDELYVADGGNKIWRYDGKTGEGGTLKSKGKVLAAVDLAVGYDGLLYIRTGESFTGPLERFTRELEPAPYPGGSNVLSPSIYSRFGIGNCEKGLGVGPHGEVYISFMYTWVGYGIGGFGGDGKALQGEYLKGKFPASPDKLKGYPTEMRSAVIGPVTDSGGGVRVDLQGNIYLGLDVQPAGFVPPAYLSSDEVAKRWYCSVAKFNPNGGAVLGLKDSESKLTDAPKIPLAGKKSLENATVLYPGLGPVSGAGPGGNSSCCVCRVPRFDVDRYGRLAIPSAFSSEVLYYDNAGNLITTLGHYGNFDSQYVNPNTEAGKAKKPTIATPDIPVSWPSGAGFTENALYLCDTYNRRAVRVDKTFQAEKTSPIP